MIAKPIRAASPPPGREEEIKFPVLASPKLDGVRVPVTKTHGVASRKFIPIPNTHIRTAMEARNLQGLDGELMTYDDTGVVHEFDELSGNIRRVKGKPHWKFHVFDSFLEPEQGFRYRTAVAKTIVKNLDDPHIVYVQHTLIKDWPALLKFRDQCLADGYEGCMYRAVNGPYKEGDSTFKEGYLVKMKLFKDTEGIIVGFIEKLRNDNIAVKDALGRTKRSTNKENMVPAGTLGKFLVNTAEWGVIPIGTGKIKAPAAQKIWDNPESCKGLPLKFRYQASGTKDKPRFPVALGVRWAGD